MITSLFERGFVNSLQDFLDDDSDSELDELEPKRKVIDWFYMF